MGYLIEEDAPVAWRGMMVVKALQQLLHEVDWGGLDILVLDLPPGTGDTQLTIAQQVVLDGMLSLYTSRQLAKLGVQILWEDVADIAVQVWSSSLRLRMLH